MLSADENEKQQFDTVSTKQKPELVSGFHSFYEGYYCRAKMIFLLLFQNPANIKSTNSRQ